MLRTTRIAAIAAAVLLGCGPAVALGALAAGAGQPNCPGAPGAYPSQAGRSTAAQPSQNGAGSHTDQASFERCTVGAYPSSRDNQQPDRGGTPQK